MNFLIKLLNKVLFMSIPLPFLSDKILYFNLFGLILFSFAFWCVVTIIYTIFVRHHDN